MSNQKKTKKDPKKNNKPKKISFNFTAEPIGFDSSIDRESESNGLFLRLKGKDFWDWNEGENHKPKYDEQTGLIDCCFNHIIGLPKNKPGLPQTIFDFQKELVDVLMEKRNDATNKHAWIKKATGIGGTAIYLRVMVWLATRDDELAGSHMCIVTGPNHTLAKDLMDRVRGLFVEFPEVEFPVNASYRMIINNVIFQSFPSNNLDAMRGISPSFILADEFGFFGKHEQDTDNPRTILERYVGKSNPYLVVMSTPNLADDIFGSIEFEKDPIYKRLQLHYSVGVNKIYTEQDIEAAKKTPSFRREYELEYLGEFGDLFKPESIEIAIEQGKTVDTNIIRQDTRKVMGVDAGYASSAFGIVVTQLNPANGRIEIIYAEEFERPDFNDMINLILKLKQNYVIEKVYVDGSNVPVIMSLKKAIGERTDYQQELLKIKQKKPPNPDRWMDIVPVYFNPEGKQMLIATYMMLDRGWLAIPSKFNKLITSLRTATAREGVLLKNQTAHSDVFDGLRMCLKRYSLPESK